MEGGVDTITEDDWFKLNPDCWGFLTCHGGIVKGEDCLTGDGTKTGEGAVMGLRDWSWGDVIPLAEIIGAGAVESILLGVLGPAIDG